MKAATLTTGLTDFGSEDFLEPLDLLIEGYRTTAHLNLKGQASTGIYLHRMLCNRLRLIETRKRFEPVVPIKRPIFILGLPRTGSTLLHELLAQHPALRAPTFWEATFLPGYTPLDRARQLITTLQISAVDLLSPGFRSVHRLGTFLPHECITLQAPSFRTMQFHAAHNVAEYNRWLESCDWKPAYDAHRQYLQWLQHRSQRTRWVLKAPGHLLSLGTLLETYPDATIIQLHRDPADVVASMASLFAHLRRPFTTRLDTGEIGKDVTRQWHLGLSRTMALRRSNPSLNERIIDIDYRDLVDSPVASVSRILAFCELAETPAVKNTLARHLASNPKNEHGNHRYSLSQFGLSRESIDELFADYRQVHVSQ